MKSNYETGIFPVVQRAGIAALRGDQTFLEHARARFQRRRDLFVDGLNTIGFSIPKPTATLYVWGAIPGKEPSSVFARRLLDQAGVAITPGAGFGECGEGYFRAAMTVDEPRLEEAVERIGRVSRERKLVHADRNSMTIRWSYESRSPGPTRDAALAGDLHPAAGWVPAGTEPRSGRGDPG